PAWLRNHAGGGAAERRTLQDRAGNSLRQPEENDEPRASGGNHATGASRRSAQEVLPPACVWPRCPRRRSEAAKRCVTGSPIEPERTQAKEGVMNQRAARRLYRSILRLHPARFRREFGDEMLWIFDEELAKRGAVPLFLDALASLGRQWMLRGAGL